jgi:sigma-B regulation protein RsbU (phosphoserine phosphatase)
VDRHDFEGLETQLLKQLGGSFRLDYPVGGRSLADRFEETIERAARSHGVEFGTSGDKAEVRCVTEEALRFSYRPHLFPGMDPSLKLGHLVQYDLLPRELPSGCPVEVAAMLESYCHLSGDLFGWHPTTDGGLTLWLLDVSGHGLRAGFAAVVFKLILADTDPRLGPAAMAKRVEKRFNEARNPDDPGCLYATGIVLTVHRDGTVPFVSAGHPPMLVRRASGRVDQIGATTLPLGLFPEIDCDDAELRLDPDDTVLVCTDGLFELRNPAEELFGVERTADLLSRTDGGPAPVIDALTDSVGSFHDLDRLDDDLCLVAFRLRR